MPKVRPPRFRVLVYGCVATRGGGKKKKIYWGEGGEQYQDPEDIISWDYRMHFQNKPKKKEEGVEKGKKNI